jgi:hypothetical protein
MSKLIWARVVASGRSGCATCDTRPQTTLFGAKTMNRASVSVDRIQGEGAREFDNADGAASAVVGAVQNALWADYRDRSGAEDMVSAERGSLPSSIPPRQGTARRRSLKTGCNSTRDGMAKDGARPASIEVWRALSSCERPGDLREMVKVGIAGRSGERSAGMRGRAGGAAASPRPNSA